MGYGNVLVVLMPLSLESFFGDMCLSTRSIAFCVSRFVRVF